MKPLTCAKSPCKSCPYRKDVPSGVWAKEEYDKLPLYDGSIIEQAMKGGIARFDCHQRDGHLCAGWVGVHGPNSLSLRLLYLNNRLDPSVFDYESPVPLFASGAEAAYVHTRSRLPARGQTRIVRPSRTSMKVAATFP